MGGRRPVSPVTDGSPGPSCDIRAHGRASRVLQWRRQSACQLVADVTVGNCPRPARPPFATRSPQAFEPNAARKLDAQETPVMTGSSRFPVDNLAESVWTSCGRSCGEWCPGRTCGGLWRNFRLIHSEARVLHSAVHMVARVPTVVRGGSPQFPQGLLGRVRSIGMIDESPSALAYPSWELAESDTSRENVDRSERQPRTPALSEGQPRARAGSNRRPRARVRVVRVCSEGVTGTRTYGRMA